MAAPELASHLEQVLREAGQVLEALDQGWALVGGLAVSARAERDLLSELDRVL